MYFRWRHKSASKGQSYPKLLSYRNRRMSMPLNARILFLNEYEELLGGVIFGSFIISKLFPCVTRIAEAHFFMTILKRRALFCQVIADAPAARAATAASAARAAIAARATTAAIAVRAAIAAIAAVAASAAIAAVAASAARAAIAAAF